MDIAVLDLGSSSFHLLHAFVHPGGRVTRLSAMREAVQLASGLRDGHLDRDSRVRAMAAVARLAARIGEIAPARLVVAATSAIREASNGPALCQEILGRHGLLVEVLSPIEEARLAFAGARSEDGGSDRVVAVDLGGGSLELAAGRALPSIVHSMSLGRLPRGCAESLARAVRAELAPVASALGKAGADRLLIASGTGRAVHRLVSAAPHLVRDELRAQLPRILSSSPGELAARGVATHRLATIGTAAVILEAVMGALGHTHASIVRSGLREGLALRQASYSGSPAPSPSMARRIVVTGAQP
jgi:exopolyphosphatase/guanosine-5'-triphosphate,3'-diphosphate pyrophosphatase